MKALLAKTLIWTALVVGVGPFGTSCVTTNSHLEPEFPDRGSAKGGAPMLMKWCATHSPSPDESL